MYESKSTYNIVYLLSVAYRYRNLIKNNFSIFINYNCTMFFTLNNKHLSLLYILLQNLHSSR